MLRLRRCVRSELLSKAAKRLQPAIEDTSLKYHMVHIHRMAPEDARSTIPRGLSAA